MIINYQKLTRDEQAQVRDLIASSKAQYPVVWGKRADCAWTFTVTSHTTNMRRHGWLIVGGF